MIYGEYLPTGICSSMMKVFIDRNEVENRLERELTNEGF